MNYIALYRKYRPKTFNEIVGQDFIKQTLKNIIKNNKISHSYMFVGPRGTGKTSTAKIFAKTINCIDKKEGVSCEKCSNCILSNKNENVDLIEMDAASNNGVDEIREIRNHVSLMPSNSKYKIYIIDEVHMLSTGAFNALLKTLEEPPEHVIFILATTDPQKVPLTIKSRCQIFEFHYISKNKIVERLKFICNKENIKIEDKALELIAENSKGGMRDAIVCLDQLASYSNMNVTVEDTLLINGQVSEEKILKLISSIESNNFNECFSMIDEFELEGKKLNIVAENIINFLKQNLLEKTISLDNSKILKMIIYFNDYLSDTKNFNDKRLMFDLALFKCFDLLDHSEKITENNEPLNKKISKIENNNITEKNNENEKLKKDYTLYKRLMDLRISNILLKADKLLLQKYIGIIKEMQENVVDLENLKIMNLLQNCNVRAASEEGILISIDNNNVLEELYENLFTLEQMFENKKIKICFILDDVWKVERKNYIEKIKNNELKYEDETDIIQSIKKLNSFQNNEFEKLIEIGE